MTSLFRQQCVKEQCNLSKTRTSTSMVLEDVADGTNVKENALLKDSCSLSVVLFQGAFEVVNLLGSGRKKAQAFGPLHDSQ